MRAPVFVVPGHADDCVTVTLGFGREGEEELARGVGFNAYALRTSGAPWMNVGVELVRTGDRASFAITQEHSVMEGRPIALAATVSELRSDPRRFSARNSLTPTLYQLKPAGPQQWAMAIDLNVCTGCSACVVACQAENNVPIVGKEGVEKGRAMHWLRIDRYFEGEADEPAVHHQPMACQHCEKAPCEYVCPVGATVHSDDGLNEMVYNRCVGTRFCSNNCPYKVRRFNWFDYNRDKPETLRMAMNPDVTVRARGVMEKCTYCVQRIRETEIRSHTSGIPIRDGDVRTACEQACPTQAITFGSIADPSSRVSRLRSDPRTYAVLHELGTEPRTRYLAKITNPNPDLGT
jgi:molybdopterin-containing oxidoreductase family iron-sulfur binding subunit